MFDSHHRAPIWFVFQLHCDLRLQLKVILFRTKSWEVFFRFETLNISTLRGLWFTVSPKGGIWPINPCTHLKRCKYLQWGQPGWHYKLQHPNVPLSETLGQILSKFSVLVSTTQRRCARLPGLLGLPPTDGSHFPPSFWYRCCKSDSVRLLLFPSFLSVHFTKTDVDHHLDMSSLTVFSYE